MASSEQMGLNSINIKDGTTNMNPEALGLQPVHRPASREEYHYTQQGRESTFPDTDQENKKSLAQAGFYHTGDGKLQCYACKAVVDKNDCRGNCPVEVHKRAARDSCLHVAVMESDGQDTAVEPSEYGNLKCKCERRPKTVLCVPCGHLSLCGPCFIKHSAGLHENEREENKTVTCNICRKLVKYIKKIRHA